MRVKDLIKELQKADPEALVHMVFLNGLNVAAIYGVMVSPADYDAPDVWKGDVVLHDMNGFGVRGNGLTVKY